MCFKNMLLKTVAVLCSVFLLGCSAGSTNRVDFTQYADPKQGHNIAIFFDGTGSDHDSRTNITKLYELAANQNNNSLKLFYTSGVGADKTTFAGMMTGLGTSLDVREAYQFLAKNYRGPQDKVHLYGFSRGSYSARILAGLVYSAGIVDIQGFTIPEQEAFLTGLFRAHKLKANNLPNSGLTQRRARTLNHLKKWGSPPILATASEFQFEVAGLWDTVEALGFPDRKDDPDSPTSRYLDQVCNIKQVFHAVALDDNRALTFTPLLMARKQLVENCPHKDIDKTVDEVWFSGAHSDVGGGYQNGYLQGVSANWMLDRTRNIGVGGRGIFPPNAAFYENPNDIAHDAENYALIFNIFDNRARGLRQYYNSAQNGMRGRALKIHRSVIDRLNTPEARVALARRLYPDGTAPNALLPSNLPAQFADCFERTPTPAPSGVNRPKFRYTFTGCEYISVVD